MSTSGVTTWELTVLQVATMAMQEIGMCSSGEAPSADELTDIIPRLNGVLKSMSVRANLFREATTDAVVTGATGEKELPQSVRDVSAVRLVVSATYERPLAPWNRAQYYAIPNRAAVGSPNAYYIEKGIGGLTLYIWPVPADDVSLKVDHSRTAETVTAGSETLDIPQEWQQLIVKKLAVEIANLFITAIDPIKLQKVAAEANELERQMLDADRPDSYTFEPAGYYY